MRRLTLKPVLLLLLAGPVAGGCVRPDGIDYLSEGRVQNGLIVILPGIEGESRHNHNIRDGLILAGIDHALPIYSWGRPVPGVSLLLNQVDVIGNRLAGVRIAEMVMRYQDAHPGKPVHLVGHSGGGGVAVFAVEALPEGRRVDGLVLLSASISSTYNLTKALSRTRNGIVNFYNRQDAALLGIGTTVMGNVDGMRGPSAGLIGFEPPLLALDRAAVEEAYVRLYQVRVTEEMNVSQSSAHFATTDAWFIAAYVARWVSAASWPALPGLAGSSVDRPPGGLIDSSPWFAERERGDGDPQGDSDPRRRDRPGTGRGSPALR